MNFTNGSIDNNWLESDALRPINTFVVFETNLWNIGVLAFAANVFDKLFILSIVDSKMSKLQKFSFLNVPVNVLVFGFTESKSSDVDFGDCVLEGMKTLKQLKIFNAINNPEQVHSLVGKSQTNQ